MLYLYEHTDRETEEFYQSMLPLLSEQRKTAVSRCRHLIDRVNGSIVYLMLRYGLQKEYGLSVKPEFVFRENEKPYLADFPEIHFSFSHCKNAAACILSDANTAVDIMDYRIRSRSAITRVCSSQELQQLEESEEPDKAFLRLWTRKECISKLNGIGLQQDFRKITDELPEMQRIHTILSSEYLFSFYGDETTPILHPDRNSLLQLSV